MILAGGLRAQQPLEPLDQSLSVSLTATQKEAVRRLAELRGTSMSEEGREALVRRLRDAGLLP